MSRVARIKPGESKSEAEKPLYPREEFISRGVSVVESNDVTFRSLVRSHSLTAPFVICREIYRNRFPRVLVVATATLDYATRGIYTR